MNISVKFQLHPPHGFWGYGFWIFFHKFNVSVAMATNQIHVLGRGLLKEHFRNTFVEKPAVRQQ